MSSDNWLIVSLFLVLALRFAWSRWCESRIEIEKEKTEQARIAAKSGKAKP